MAGGYEHKPDGTEGVGGILKQLQNQVNALRGGAGIRSAILRGVQLVFQNEDGVEVATIGTQQTTRANQDGDRTSDVVRGVRFLDPASNEVLLSASSFQSDGYTFVQAGGTDDRLDLFIVQADRTALYTNGSLELRELPTTASAANLYIETPGVNVMRVTSGRKYKEDIADADIDIEDVLKLTARTWVDKGKIDRDDPGDIRRNIGFIAEELDDLPSLRQFVVYDENGDPDGIEYDRLTVALLAVLKDQDKRLTSIEERLDALGS